MCRKICIERYYVVLLMLFSAFSLFAQTKVSGVVTDAKTNETLIGVNIVFANGAGTTTNIDGYYEVNLDPGKHELTFKYTGYEELVKNIDVGSDPVLLNIKMGETNSVLDVVVVSGSRFERKIKEETVTIDVITPDIIERDNNTDLAEVVKRVPGVEVIDGQANIRSGSGYAYGAGSRVSVLVDDQPLLSAELSDVKWNFIPLENASQIEIIKGSASVLYGSSALNGVIHVRTAMPTDEPYTSISLYSGVYNGPRTQSRKWWANTKAQPFQVGAYFAHREKIRSNFDLVVGGNVHILEGYLKGGDERRFRLNVNTRYRPVNNERLTYGLNTNVMYHEIANFFLWMNGGDSAFVHISPTYTRDDYSTLTVDPWLTYFDKYENKHTVKARYFNISKIRGRNNENSVGNIGSLEYQFHRNFKHDYKLSAGALGQYFKARSVLFTRDSLGNFTSQGGLTTALYAQVDKQYFNRLNITAGLRWESFRVDERLVTALPVLRLGANYKLTENSNLRASFGGGYRVPSLGERYIDDNIEAINIFPNPELKVEKGWSGEVGYKRGVKTKKFEGYFDAALFWMEYKDMTEFYFDLYTPDGQAPNLDSLSYYVGFKAVNISRARIAGTEFSLFGEGNIGVVPVRTWVGYTYSFPGDLSQDTTQRKLGPYLRNFFSGLGKVSEELNTSILKYRSLHNVRLSIEGEYKNFILGFNASYNSFVHNIDAILAGKHLLSPIVESELPGLVGIREFRDAHSGGDFIMDVRLVYRINKHHDIRFISNNIFNREYMLRAGKMSAPRSFHLRYNWKF